MGATAEEMEMEIDGLELSVAVIEFERQDDEVYKRKIHVRNNGKRIINDVRTREEHLLKKDEPLDPRSEHLMDAVNEAVCKVREKEEKKDTIRQDIAAVMEAADEIHSKDIYD